MATGEVAGNESRRHPLAGRVIKVDAAFIATMISNKTPEGLPPASFIGDFTSNIGEDAKPWAATKVTTFLHRLMEKQRVA